MKRISIYLRQFRLTALLAAAFIVMSGCDEEKTVPKLSLLEASPENIAATNVVGKYSIEVTSEESWTAGVSSESPWCTVSPVSASGNGTVSVNVTENMATTARTATISIANGTVFRVVTVTQEAAPPPPLSVTPTAIAAEYSAGTYYISVASSTNWTATVSSGAPWCTVSPASASGNGTVTVIVEENTAALQQRTATITLSGGSLVLQVSVTQAGAPVLLTVEPASIDAAYTPGTYEFAVTSNTNWTATVSGAPWCTFSPASGSGNGTVTVNVAENAEYASRTAAITVTAGTENRTVTVKQASAPVPAPPHAQSEQTWTFGNIPTVWSDFINVSNCAGTPWVAGLYTVPIAQCTSADPFEDGNIYYYYTWPYVRDNAATLCPAPWRLPTPAEGQEMAEYLSNQEIFDLWGAPGTIWWETFPIDQGSDLMIWTDTEGNIGSDGAPIAYGIRFCNWGKGQWEMPQIVGGQVRCVR